MSKILDSTGKAIPSKSIDIDDGDSVIIFKNNGNFSIYWEFILDVKFPAFSFGPQG